MRFKALDHACPRCDARPHKACRKLNNIGPTGFLRIPHAERRSITGEGTNATAVRRRASARRVWVDFNDIDRDGRTTTLVRFGPDDLKADEDVEAYDFEGTTRPARVMRIDSRGVVHLQLVL